MANYAVVFGDYVSNVVAAESAEIVLEVTHADEAIKTEGNPWIGWVRINGVWVDPSIQPEPADA